MKQCNLTCPMLLDSLCGVQGDITSKGKQVASLPVEPVWGAVLLAAARLGCMDQALVIVAMASTDPFFVQTR